MTLRVVNQGEKAFLDAILANNYSLRLFKNDVEASASTAALKDALTEANFTEANFIGYASAALTGGSWTTATGDPSTASYAVQTFTSASTQTVQTVYGYYVVKVSDGKLHWYEYFSPSAASVQFNGQTITVTPRMTLSDTSD